MKRILKEKEGITLIALIITIVVLLILAIAAISAVQDSGIITYAKKAASETELAQIREQAELIKMNLLLDLRQNKDILALKEEYMERLKDEFKGRIDGNKVVVEKDKYEIEVKNTNLDILVKEYTNKLAIKTAITRENVVENEKIYVSKITCNLEMNMTSQEYDEMRKEQIEQEYGNVTPDEKRQKVLDAKNEEYIEYDVTFSTIDEMVNYELFTFWGDEYESIDGWNTHIADNYGIEDTTKENIYYFYYNWGIYDIEEKYTETELIDKLYADYYLPNTNNEYSNEKSGLTVYVIRNGIQDEEPLKENISLPNSFTFATDKNGTYEFIVKNRNKEIVAFEEININNIETERNEKYVSSESTEWKTSGHGWITGYLGSDTSIIIPKYVGAEYIDTIDDFDNNKNIKEIKMLDSIKKISAGAFEGSENLTKIEIPSSVKTLNNWTFSGCSSLQEIVIPDTITQIGTGAFVNCKGLKEIVIPDSVTTIGDDGCFTNCTSLEKVVLSSSIYRIPKRTFLNCIALKEIEIKNVKNIEEEAFKNCRMLEKITLPDSVKSICNNNEGKGTFVDCVSLKNIYFAPGDNQIPDGQPWGAPAEDINVEKLIKVEN